MEVKQITFPVEMLTGHYQVSGALEVRGNPAVFVNDASFNVFTVHDATLTPLAAGSPVGQVKVARLYVPRAEPHVVLIGNFAPQDAQLLPHKINLVAFTDTYVIRGDFHAGPETKADDALFYAAGPYFAATDAEIYAMRPLSADLGGEADLVYINRNHVRAFYSG